jgi:hypothetical protein
MLRFLFLSICVMSANAFADFNGFWVGTNGYATGDVQSSCDKIQISIVQGSSALTVSTRAYTCGDLAVDTHSFQFVIAQNDLIVDGEIVGHIDDAAISYKIMGSNVADVFSVSKSDKDLTYQENFNFGGASANVTATLSPR